MIKIEMTDTYCGETNYSWVTREEDTQSETLIDAIRRFKRRHGIKRRNVRHCHTGDFYSVDLQGACIRIMAWWE